MGRADTKKCFLRKVQHLPDVGACSGDFTARASLSPERIRLLKIRSGCRKSLQYVCDGHFTKFIHRFEAHQKNCCLHQSTSVHDGPPAKKKKTGTPQLHVITLQMRDSAKTIGLALVPGKKVCVKCKIDLNAKIKAAEKSAAEKAAQESSSNAPDPASISNPPIFSSPSVGSTLAPSDITTPTVPADNKASKEEFFQESIDGLNTWLSSLGFSPVNERKLKTQKSYGRKVMKKIRAALTKFSDQQLTEDEDAAYFREIIGQLQQFIDCHPQPDKKLLALSVVPKSWSISRIESTFGVSNYMARKSRLLVQDKGILCGPGPKVGRKLSPETVELITKFYYRDDISRPLPGAKDVLSVLVDGKRVKKTKRLVLSTLSCLHQKFKEEHPDHKVSLAKFCELRPKECVLAGSAGTHVICVCTYHQNPELMFEAGNLSEAGLENIKACKKLLLCSEPSEDCFFRRCNDCCDSTVLQEKLEVYFDSEMISTVVYNQWESTDRANIVTLSKSTDDFISEFISQIESLIPHDFISKVQANFYKESIENLKDGEVVVNVDFAENFSFVVQNSSQGWYFNNKQATLHPCLIYYKDAEGKVCHSAFVLISDHLDHSTAAVHTFQKKLIRHITEDLKIKLAKIKYFSDGCAAQYKNKKAAANVWFHERDFGVPAEWHFYATSHGKTACDGVGGMIKHTTMLHCLRLTAKDPQITIAYDFYDWVSKNIQGVTAKWVPKEEVIENEKALLVRFETAFDIDGIKSHHALIPRVPSKDILLKLYSQDTKFNIKKICTKEFELDYSEVKGFVTFTEDENSWKLGCVSEFHEEDENFSVQVMEATGQPRSYKFTDIVIIVSLHDIVSLVNPYFQAKGTIVKLRVSDAKAADVKLKSKKKNMF